MRTDGGLGRLLFFWCNTTPLPELPTANGVWDIVATIARWPLY
ncbi:hypothetical protein [Prevotella sp.]|nr:hypothetical protein [uncultured Prevotella sp.]